MLKLDQSQGLHKLLSAITSYDGSPGSSPWATSWPLLSLGSDKRWLPLPWLMHGGRVCGEPVAQDSVCVQMAF